jgi:hypothetical protein
MLDKLETVIDTAGRLYSVAKAFGNTDLLGIIELLQNQLTETKEADWEQAREIDTLRSEIRQLKTEIQNLTDMLAEELVFKVSAYYRKDTDEAFCPGCFDSKHALARLIPYKGNNQMTRRCPVCNNRYKLH